MNRRLRHFIPHLRCLSYFFDLPLYSGNERPPNNDPACGLHSSDPRVSRESERKIDVERRRGDEISSYEIVFLSPNTVLRDRTRRLSASRISIERPFPVRFHVAKKITRRWIRHRESISFAKESRHGYGIKLPLAFAFHAKRSATISVAAL